MVALTDDHLLPLPLAPASSGLDIVLRDYQEGARDAITGAFHRGVRRQLIVLPTGTGKTVVFSSLPQALEFSHSDVLLVIAHTDELLDQAIGAFRRRGVLAEKEKSTLRASSFSNIVVASAQSLHGKRREELAHRFGGRFRGLVIDEAHRSMSRSYQTIVEWFTSIAPEALVLGVTATPKRGDGVGLGGIYEEIVFVYDLSDAISDGWLVPINGWRVSTNVDLRGVKTSRGDYDPRELDAQINIARRNGLIANVVERLNKRAIVFCGSVGHARAVADMVDGVEAVWGEMGKDLRKSTLDAFKEQRLRGLVCQNLLVEGFDDPSVEAVVIGRPTQSPVIYSQSVGRGLRPHGSIAHLLSSLDVAGRRAAIAGSSKPSCAVVDLVDITKRQTLLTIPSLFGLDPSMDLRGSDPLTKIVPPRISGLDSGVEQVEMTSVQEIDLLKTEQIDAVDDDPVLHWVADGGRRDGLRLTTMPIVRGRDADGNLVNLSGMLEEERALYRDVRRAPLVASVFPDPEDPALYCAIIEWGKWWHHRLAHHARRSQLCAAVEAWIKNRAPDAISALDPHAEWRSKPPTPGQIRLLERFRKPIPATSGEAKNLIDTAIEESKKKKYFINRNKNNKKAKEEQSVEPIRWKGGVAVHPEANPHASVLDSF